MDCRLCVYVFERVLIWDDVFVNGFIVVSKFWFGCIVLVGCVVLIEVDVSYILVFDRGFCFCIWFEIFYEFDLLIWGVVFWIGYGCNGGIVLGILFFWFKFGIVLDDCIVDVEFVFSLLNIEGGWFGVLFCVVGFWEIGVLNDVEIGVGVFFCSIRVLIVGGNCGIVGFFVNVL